MTPSGSFQRSKREIWVTIGALPDSVVTQTITNLRRVHLAILDGERIDGRHHENLRFRELLVVLRQGQDHGAAILFDQRFEVFPKRRIRL